MKKKEFSKLALLGIVSGLMAGQVVEATDSNSIDIQYLLAKPGCKSHGCESLTAERELHHAPGVPDDEDDGDMFDEDDTEEDAKNAPVKKTV